MEDIGEGRVWRRHVDHIRARYDGQERRKPTNSEDGHIESANKDAGAKNDTAGKETRVPQAPELGTEIPVGGTHTEGGEERVDPRNIQSDTPPVENAEPASEHEGTVASAEPHPQHPTAQLNETTHTSTSRRSPRKRKAPDRFGWQLTLRKVKGGV